MKITPLASVALVKGVIRGDGENYELAGALIYWESAFGKQYEILVSTTSEADSWTHVVSDGTTQISYLEFDTTISGSYICMQGIECQTKYGYSIYEMQVFSVVKETVDKTSLEQLVLENSQRIQSDYTPETWLLFEN